MKIFVYGTLKTGECRNSALSTATLLSADARVNGHLVSLGGFPGLFPSDQNTVLGELWEIDDKTLESLDWIEGHPHFFERRPIKELTTGEEVISYFFNDPHFFEDLEPKGGTTFEWDGNQVPNVIEKRSN